MTWRRGKRLLIGMSVLYVLIIAAAVYFSWTNRPKPIPFVDPVIWSERPIMIVPPGRQFSI